MTTPQHNTKLLYMYFASRVINKNIKMYNRVSAGCAVQLNTVCLLRKYRILFYFRYNVNLTTFLFLLKLNVVD